MKGKTRKILSLVLTFGLILQQLSFAQVAAELNIAGHLSRLNANLVQDKFRPLQLRYFSYDSLNDNFRVLLDKGDVKQLDNFKTQEQAKTLLSYFLIGVTLPDDTFWVNLRPDSENQIIDQYLEKTDIGKIMLEADLQLKKDTASFTSPQAPEGREYWDRLYKKAGELYGYDNVTIPTLTRPWIVPGEIIIRESKDSAYVYKATLKVMLEQDYLKDSATYNFKDERAKELNDYSSQLIRELIIPKLTKEVNSSKRYANLRQVYYSLILARWFKLRFAGKSGTYSQLIDTRNLTNLASQETWSKTTYFKQYQKSFSKGEYNIQEPVYTPTGQVIRSYFSGGEDLTGKTMAIPTTNNPLTNGNIGVFGGNLRSPAIPIDKAGLIAMEGKGADPLSISSPITTTHLDEDSLSGSRTTIRNAVVSSQPIPLNELISSLPQNSALRNALISLRQIQGRFSDEDVQRIIKENDLNAAEQVAFVLVVQPGQGVGNAANQIIVDGINLSERWKNLVSEDNGKAFTTESAYDGQEVTWDGIHLGDVLRLGLKLDVTGKIIYWGENKTRNEGLNRAVKSDPVKDSEGRDTSFIKVLNEYRALRPNAMKTKPVGRQLDPKSIHPDNEKSCPFGCVDPIKGNSLLNREVSWEGKINGRMWRAQFNAATFEENGHFLWVPDIYDPKQRRAQKVIAEDVSDILALARESTNMIFFFNDPHAGGTVNHIHFQSIYHKEELAIEKSALMLLTEIDGVKVSMLNNYLVEGLVFSINDKSLELAKVIFAFVNLLQERKIPFNLIFIKDKIYLIPRNPEGEIVAEFPTGVLASAELCGKIIIVDEKTYNGTDFDKVQTAFRKITVTKEEIEKLVENVKKSSSSPAANEEDLGLLFDKFLSPDANVKTLAKGAASRLSSEELRQLIKLLRDKYNATRDKSPLEENQDYYGLGLEDPIVAVAAKEALEYLEALERNFRESSSSSMQSAPGKTGGVDFRTLPMSIQPMGSFSGLNFKLPQLNQAELRQININSEMQQIKNMVRGGITPSGERIKELIAACVQKKEMNSQIDNLLLCLADIFKLEEENASESSPELREALVIVDSQS